MANVSFDVSRSFDVAARVLWDELVDWPRHGAWIPATTIESGPGHPTDVGYTFTAWTGFRPLALQDRMRVTRCDWDEVTHVGHCTVDKLGPVLGGSAGFTVRSDGAGSRIDWHEEVTIPYVPQLLSPIAAFAGAVGFRVGLRSLAKVIGRRTA